MTASLSRCCVMQNVSSWPTCVDWDWLHVYVRPEDLSAKRNTAALEWTNGDAVSKLIRYVPATDSTLHA